MDSSGDIIKLSRNDKRMLRILESGVFVASLLIVLFFVVPCSGASLNVSEIDNVEFFKTDEDAQKRVLDLARLEKEEMEKESLKDKGSLNQVTFDSSNDKPNETLVNPRKNENTIDSLNEMANSKEENNRVNTAGKHKQVSSSKGTGMFPAYVDESLNEISGDQENHNNNIDSLVNITKYSLQENEAQPSPQQEKSEAQFEGIAENGNMNSEVVDGKETLQSQNTSEEVQKVEQLSDENGITQDKNLSDDIPTPIETLYESNPKLQPYENVSVSQNPTLNEPLSNINQFEAGDNDYDINGTVDSNSISQQNVNLSNPELERQNDDFLQAQANMSTEQGTQSPEMSSSEDIQSPPTEQTNSPIEEEEVTQKNYSFTNFSGSNDVQTDTDTEPVLDSYTEQRENNSISPQINIVNGNSEDSLSTIDYDKNNIKTFKNLVPNTDSEINTSIDDYNETNTSGSSSLNEEAVGNSLGNILGLFNKNTLVLNSENNDNVSNQNTVPQYTDTQSALTADIEEGERGTPMEVQPVLQANINILDQKSDKANQNLEQMQDNYNAAKTSKEGEYAVPQELRRGDAPINVEERGNSDGTIEGMATEQNSEANITDNNKNIKSEQVPETQLERYPDFNNESETSSNLRGKVSDKNNKDIYSILHDILFGTKTVQGDKDKEVKQLENESNNQRERESEQDISTKKNINNNPQMEVPIQPNVDENSGINEEIFKNILKNNSELNDDSPKEMNSKTEEIDPSNESEQGSNAISESEEPNRTDQILPENVPSDQSGIQNNLAKQLTGARSLLINNLLKESEENLKAMEELKEQNKMLQEILNTRKRTDDDDDADDDDEHKYDQKLTTVSNVPSHDKAMFDSSDDEDILTQKIEKGTNILKLNSTNNCENAALKNVQIPAGDKILYEEISESTMKENIPGTIPCYKGGETDMKKDEPLTLFSHFPPEVYTDRAESGILENVRIKENDDVAASPVLGSRNDKARIHEREHLRDNTSALTDAKDLIEGYSSSTETGDIVSFSEEGVQKNSSLDLPKADDNSTVFSLIDLISGQSSNRKLNSENLPEKDISTGRKTKILSEEQGNTKDKLSSLIRANGIKENFYLTPNETVNSKTSGNGRKNGLSVDKERIHENSTRASHAISKRTSASGKDFPEEEDLDEEEDREFNIKSDPKRDERGKSDEREQFFNEEGITNDTLSSQYNRKTFDEDTQELSLKKEREDNLKDDDDDEDEEIGTDLLSLDGGRLKNQTSKGIPQNNIVGEDKTNDKLHNTKDLIIH